MDSMYSFKSADSAWLPSIELYNLAIVCGDMGKTAVKVQDGMVSDVMGDIEGYTDYYKLLEDIGNAESSEGYESECNTLSMHIKHVMFIEGHKLIEGRRQEHNTADGAVCECMKPQSKHIHQHL